MTHSEWLQAFVDRRAVKHTHKSTETVGDHPKHTGIGKKNTSFYPGCCNVLFDRKTIPKSGKSIKDGFFIKDKGTYSLVYDIQTRALLGLDINKLKEYRELLNDRIESSINEYRRV